MSRLFCFGLGYSAQALARRLADKGWIVQGTSSRVAGAVRLAAMGYEAFVFDGIAPGPGIRAALREATHVLVSIPPVAAGDPCDPLGDLVLRHHGQDLAEADNLQWIGYLSTIGVYGDRQGEWVDETSALRPTSERSIRRIPAERFWLLLGEWSGKCVQIFRLAGIYGPGRSAIESLRAGTAKRIVKPGQVFNRIHVDDIAGILAAAIENGGRHDIYNVTDDEPAPPQDLVAHAARLLGMAPPPEIAFAETKLSEMARSFYSDNKRVRNERIKADLGVGLLYPTYREGLEAIAKLSSKVHL